MQMLKDILIWRVLWTPTTMNIRTQGMPFVAEASRMALTGRISHRVVVILIVAHLLFVLTVVASVWAATLSLVVKKGRNVWQKENLHLISE